jgi:hypothetical protein
MSNRLPIRVEAGSSSREDLVRALTGRDPGSDITVARTRRRVQTAVIDREEQRVGRRRQTGLVMMISLVVLSLLAPAIWSSVETLHAGGHFADFQTQTYLLALILFPALVAAATGAYIRGREREDGREP